MAVERIRAAFDFSNTPGNMPKRDIVDGAAAIQQADGLLFTRKPDKSTRVTDLRPMSEQLASGPLQLAMAAKANAASLGTAAAKDVGAVGGVAATGANSDITSLEGTTANPGIRLRSASTTLASAATVDLGAAPTRKVAITGAITIASFGTIPHAEVLVRFEGAPTLTYNATSLRLPGAADLVTAAGDTCIATSDATGNWTVRHYQRASGKPLVGPTAAEIGLGIADNVIFNTMSGTAGSAGWALNTTAASNSERRHWKLADNVGTVAGILTGGSSLLIRFGANLDLRFNMNAARTQFNTLPLSPGGDNVSGNSLGEAALRWPVVYSATAAISTSDARSKLDRDGNPLPEDHTVSSLTDAEIAAASTVAREIGAYVFKDAAAAKGNAARLHIGTTVQRVIAILEAHGLDPLRYAFICHDAWDAEPDVPETMEDVLDEDGEPTGETVTIPGRPGREAGERYSFRGEELSYFIARGQEARLAALEARL